MSKLTTLAARVANSVALLLCAVALAAPVAVTAQETQSTTGRQTPAAPVASPTPAPNAAAPAAATTTDNHDLSITANVTARELLFEVVPNPTVEFSGRPRRDTSWEAERTNLPPQVQPGVTYRDIGIRLRITSVFADIERIVAEALGEIPTSDDNPPQLNSNENVRPQADEASATSDTAEAAADVPPMATSSMQTSRASSARPTPARRVPTRRRKP